MVAASKSASARGDVVAAGGDVLGAAVAQQGGDGVVGRWRRRPREDLLQADEALADAVAQLARGHAGEGHEQEVVEPRPLGDVARGEGGDRVRLARAGAGLEHGDPGRQRAAGVEGADLGGRAHRSSRCSWASRRSQSRWASAAKRPSARTSSKSARRRGRARARGRGPRRRSGPDSHLSAPALRGLPSLATAST